MTLTQRDFDEIEKIIEEKLDNKIKFVPSKKEFFSAMDKIMGELQEIRDELTITGNQLRSEVPHFLFSAYETVE